MSPEKEEALKIELDELVTALDVELSPQRCRQMRRRVEEIRGELQPPKSKIKYNLLKD